MTLFDPHEWDARLRETVEPHILRTALVGADMEASIFKAVAARRKELSQRTEDILIGIPPEVAGHMRVFMGDLFATEYWERIQGVTAATTQRVLDTGFRDNLSTPDIARSLQSEFERMSDVRALRIARTETTGALNAGAWAVRQDLASDGLIRGQEWQSIIDQDTRSHASGDAYDHIQMDGQKVAANQQFNVSGEMAPFPGHFGLSAGNRVNCRCGSVSITILDDEIPGLPPPDLNLGPIPDDLVEQPQPRFKPGDSIPRESLREHFDGERSEAEARDRFRRDIEQATKSEGKIKTHGMSDAEDMAGVDIDGIKFAWSNVSRETALLDIENYLRHPLGIPQRLWESTQRVVWSNQRNSADDYWAETYNTPGFTSLATGGDGTVVVYNNNRMTVGTFAHESGHNLAKKVWGQTKPKGKYAEAQLEEEPVTEYGKNSPDEDFAEACELYVRSRIHRETLKTRFPKKFKALEELLSGNQ